MQSNKQIPIEFRKNASTSYSFRLNALQEKYILYRGNTQAVITVEDNINARLGEFFVYCTHPHGSNYVFITINKYLKLITDIRDIEKSACTKYIEWNDDQEIFLPESINLGYVKKNNYLTFIRNDTDRRYELKVYPSMYQDYASYLFNFLKRYSVLRVDEHYILPFDKYKKDFKNGEPYILLREDEKILFGAPNLQSNTVQSSMFSAQDLEIINSIMTKSQSAYQTNIANTTTTASTQIDDAASKETEQNEDQIDYNQLLAIQKITEEMSAVPSEKNIAELQTEQLGELPQIDAAPFFDPYNMEYSLAMPIFTPRPNENNSLGFIPDVPSPSELPKSLHSKRKFDEISYQPNESLPSKSQSSTTGVTTSTSDTYTLLKEYLNQNSNPKKISLLFLSDGFAFIKQSNEEVIVRKNNKNIKLPKPSLGATKVKMSKEDFDLFTYKDLKSLGIYNYQMNRLDNVVECRINNNYHGLFNNPDDRNNLTLKNI